MPEPKPTSCPDCECPLIWTNENTALCACNGDAYNRAREERSWEDCYIVGPGEDTR